MPHRLADELCRRAATVLDPVARIQLFRTLVAELPGGMLEDAVAVLVERAGMRDTHAQVALLTLQAARAGGLPVGAEAGTPGGSEEPRVPDYGKGRALTLGERKSLVRGHDRRLLDRALFDPHPDVIGQLLQNPRVIEADVVRICAMRPGQPEVLARVARNPRWASRVRVRKALVLNPATPEAIAGAIVPLLSREDLHEVARDDRLAPEVRRRCLEVLSRLPPIPDDPSGEVH